MTDVRMAVYEALLEAEEGDALPGSIGHAMLEKYAFLGKQQRAFMHFMYEGVIDKKITLDYVIDSVSSMPVRKMKKPVKCILRMGAYQILFMDSVPDSAACNESVKIAKKKHLNNLAGFINGVLRNIARLDKSITYPAKDKDCLCYLSVRYSMPLAVVQSLVADYGEDHAEQIFNNILTDRPLIGRTITSKCSTVELIDRLNRYDNVKVKKIHGLDAFEFERIGSLNEIDEFNNGLFTIQDVSSQLVGKIAGIRKNDCIIDVCAAPGGKSMHAADILKSLGSDSGGVVSCDISMSKTEKIKENIDRCGLDNIDVRIQDATVLSEDDTKKYDICICDAPCSGMGIMGRKRDIKYGITEEGLENLCSLQRGIIDNSVTYVKSGGTFIYSTCTMRKAENDEQYRYIKDSLGLVPCDFYDELPDEYKNDTAHDGYLQLFAGESGTDGFFISKFHTRA